MSLPTEFDQQAFSDQVNVMARGIQINLVQNPYKILFERVSSRISYPENPPLFDLMNLTRTEHFSNTSRLARDAFAKAMSGSTNYTPLLAAVYAVTDAGGLLGIVMSSTNIWGLKHICSFLLSSRGRLYLAGLHNIRCFDFARRAEVVMQGLENSLLGSLTSETVKNVAVAAQLLGDLTFVARLGSRTRSSFLLATFTQTFQSIFETLWETRQSVSQAMLRMQRPNNVDFENNLRLRLLTYLYFPNDAALPANQLARLNFVSTGRHDEIQCIKCQLVSRDLKVGEDVMAHKFHRDDCSSIREARLSFRMTTYKNFPLQYTDVTKLAKDGLYYLGAENKKPHYKYKLACYSCHKKTDYLRHANDPTTWHQDVCHREIDQEAATTTHAQHVERLSRIKCSRCNERAANVLALKCCHFILCQECYANSPVISHCPRCQASIERCSVLY